MPRYAPIGPLPDGKKTVAGFTLIELTIVVAIIAILAAIAMPQFAMMITRSQEATTKGNLGAMRSALATYYGDTEGMWPLSVSAALTTNKKYLRSVPLVYLPKTPYSIGHVTTNTAWTYTANAIGSNFSAPDGTGVGFLPPKPFDFLQKYADNSSLPPRGGWAYDAAPTDGQYGTVQIFCVHRDLRGVVWNTY